MDEPEQHWTKLLGTLDAILEGRTGLTEGCREVLRIGEDLRADSRMLDPFRGFEAVTRGFPLGDARKMWSAKSLEKKDSERAKTEDQYRDWILQAARQLHAHAKVQSGQGGPEAAVRKSQ